MIKINIQATLDFADAPNADALAKLAVAFFQMRGALVWAEGATTDYETNSQAEKDIFRQTLRMLAAAAVVEITPRDQPQDQPKREELDQLESLRKKVETNRPPVGPLVSIIGDDEPALMRPTVKVGQLAEAE